jgi:peptidoglycan lytic transglycosylase
LRLPELGLGAFELALQGPCDTKVRLRYHGRDVNVRVSTAASYVDGRDFDLTAATRQRLRFPSTGTLLSSR